MKFNNRGITLVELLITITLMAVVLSPITMIVIYTLKTEQQVSTKNEVQREARFIMEYMTEKMRDKDVYWIESGQNLHLCLFNGSSCTEIYLIYNESNQQMILADTGHVLSEHVTIEVETGTNPPNPAEVILTIDKSGEVLELKSHIYYNRF
ncbi:type II secretion system protein [Anaerobacillus sp. CMMVII]|uniref:PilW family protein n=1 Tax=Anaerobacillus sp. CMMVII TaxID=2755588 RepID=UPI0021B75EF2|nr:type II secretion system protein [Anaerobacillus sp. CMMVII]MCT8137493.1 type II secretion system protein [Anaerobacillus sp. CMMVII]